jgi:hypothetical protein
MSKLPYHSGRETKHPRKLLDKALEELLKRRNALPLVPTKKQRSHASIKAVAEKFGIGRTTLGYYIRRKLK